MKMKNQYKILFIQNKLKTSHMKKLMKLQYNIIPHNKNKNNFS